MQPKTAHFYRIRDGGGLVTYTMPVRHSRILGFLLLLVSYIRLKCRQRMCEGAYRASSNGSERSI